MVANPKISAHEVLIFNDQKIGLTPYYVVYNKNSERFYAYVVDEKLGTPEEKRLSGANMEELKKAVAAYDKGKRTFKPIEAIRIYNNERGRITSRTADEYNTVIFVTKSKDGYTQRNTQYIESSSRGKPEFSFCLPTEANVKNLAYILQLEQQIADLYKKIEQTKLQYKDFITWEMIEEAPKE